MSCRERGSRSRGRKNGAFPRGIARELAKTGKRDLPDGLRGSTATETAKRIMNRTSKVNSQGASLEDIPRTISKTEGLGEVRWGRKAKHRKNGRVQHWTGDEERESVGATGTAKAARSDNRKAGAHAPGVEPRGQ